jgi:hypothetical protein
LVTEAYNELVSTLKELDEKYDSIESLTAGTEEWKDAVKDVNKEVLDLIKKYPELAAFVENKQGILTIDYDDEGV